MSYGKSQSLPKTRPSVTDMAAAVVDGMTKDELEFCADFIEKIVIENGGSMPPEKIAEKIQASVIHHPAISKVDMLTVLLDIAETTGGKDGKQA